MTVDQEGRAPARRVNHECHEISLRETQISTIYIVPRDREKIPPLSHYDSRHNIDCHVEKAWTCPRCGEAIAFRPRQFGRSLAALNKSKPFGAISRFTPTRLADGTKPPEGTWRAMHEAAGQAYREARREVYPSRKAKQP